MRGTIEHNEEVQVKCPSSDGCFSVLQEREIRGLADDVLYQKYLDQAIAIAERSSKEKSFHCKTPNCKGFTFLENNPNITEFLCPTCGHLNCLMCHAIHENTDCREHQRQQLDNPTDENSRATGLYLQVCFAF